MSTERVKYPESLENLLSVILLSSFDRETPSLSQVMSGVGIPVAVQVNDVVLSSLIKASFGWRRIVTGSSEHQYSRPVSYSKHAQLTLYSESESPRVRAVEVIGGIAAVFSSRGQDQVVQHQN